MALGAAGAPVSRPSEGAGATQPPAAAARQQANGFRACAGRLRMCGVKIDHFDFGSIRVNGVTYRHDVVVDHGTVRERKKGPSKHLREEHGHTPLSAEERIPWECERLVIGTGAYGALPVTDEVVAEARRRRVELVVLPTAEAIPVLCADAGHANAILHVTC